MTDANSLESLLDAYLGFDVPKEGDIRSGHIVSKRNSEILVDIGAKSEGVIPSDEIDQLSSQQLDGLHVGDEIQVYVVNPEDDRGNTILSYLKVAEEEDWRNVAVMQRDKKSLPCTVIGSNKGGALVQVGTLRGFLPASQLGSANAINRSQSADNRLRRLIGKTLNVRVLEADRDRGRLIVSEMEAERHERDAIRTARLAELEVGGRYDGKVINVTDFGAFIDIGGIEGLVHTSELSWKHVNKPSDLLKVGQDVTVSILEIDHGRKRINLSMKQLETDPWEKIDEICAIGQLCEVTITQLTHYGAFARINDSYRLEGLIHISEMSSDHIKSPKEVVRKGETLTVRIIRIDSEQKQIGFSIKQVFSQDFMEQDLAMQNSA